MHEYQELQTFKTAWLCIPYRYQRYSWSGFSDLFYWAQSWKTEVEKLDSNHWKVKMRSRYLVSAFFPWNIVYCAGCGCQPGRVFTVPGWSCCYWGNIWSWNMKPCNPDIIHPHQRLQCWPDIIVSTLALIGS